MYKIIKDDKTYEVLSITFFEENEVSMHCQITNSEGMSKRESIILTGTEITALKTKIEETINPK